jgi:hypothetical protein
MNTPADRIRAFLAAWDGYDDLDGYVPCPDGHAVSITVIAGTCVDTATGEDPSPEAGYDRLYLTFSDLRALLAERDARVDFAEYAVFTTDGGTTLIQHAVDGCNLTEPDIGEPGETDTLGGLTAIAIRHHTERHTHPQGIITVPAEWKPEEVAEFRRRWDEEFAGRHGAVEIRTGPETGGQPT